MQGMQCFAYICKTNGREFYVNGGVEWAHRNEEQNAVSYYLYRPPHHASYLRLGCPIFHPQDISVLVKLKILVFGGV